MFCAAFSFSFPKPFLPLKETRAVLGRLGEELRNAERQVSRRIPPEQGAKLQEPMGMQGQGFN